MIEDNWTEDTLTLAGKEIKVKRGEIQNSQLNYYPENPRIYSIMFATGIDQSQEEIEAQLIKMNHVKQLVQSIKSNGGLIDPLMVRDGDYIVLEGNSRLAAYRALTRTDALKWGMVKCVLLPADIGEDLIFALLTEYHMVGRKDWAPYEQAGCLWRRYKHHGVDPATIAKQTGLPTRQVRFLIEVYSFMLDQQVNDINHWSYFYEYLKSRKIGLARKTYPELDSVVVEQVKSGRIRKAEDIRDKLPAVAETGGKTLKSFITERVSLGDSYERAVALGSKNVILNKLKKFRKDLADQEVIRKELKTMGGEQLKRCRFELKKILQIIERLYKKVDGLYGSRHG